MTCGLQTPQANDRAEEYWARSEWPVTRPELILRSFLERRLGPTSGLPKYVRIWRIYAEAD